MLFVVTVIDDDDELTLPALCDVESVVFGCVDMICIVFLTLYTAVNYRYSLNI